MKKLSLILLLALPCAAADPAAPEASTAAPAATPPPGSLDSSKIRLDAHDLPGALADAESVVAKGGGADAFAARADAKRALGMPIEQVLADYAQAVKLDPRYLEKYDGLVAQVESEKHPQKAKGGTGLGGVPIGVVGLGLIAGAACVIGGVAFSRRGGARPAAPDDEAVHPGGKTETPKDAPADPDKPRKDIS